MGSANDAEYVEFWLGLSHARLPLRGVVDIFKPSPLPPASHQQATADWFPAGIALSAMRLIL